jgi:hypothetical protein
MKPIWMALLLVLGGCRSSAETSAQAVTKDSKDSPCTQLEERLQRCAQAAGSDREVHLTKSAVEPTAPFPGETPDPAENVDEPAREAKCEQALNLLPLECGK